MFSNSYIGMELLGTFSALPVNALTMCAELSFVFKRRAAFVTFVRFVVGMHEHMFRYVMTAFKRLRTSLAPEQ